MKVIPSRSKAMSIVTFINLVTPLSGLIMELVFAWIYGTSLFLDSFRVSVLIILLGTQFLSVYLLPHILIPIYTNYQSKKGEERGWNLLFTIGFIISFFLFFFILFTYSNATTIVKYLGPGLDPTEGISTATILIHFFSPVLLLMVWCGIFSTVLNIHKKYLLTSLVQVIPNLTIIIFIIVFYKNFNSAYVVGLAVLIAYIIMTLILFFNFFYLFKKKNYFLFKNYIFPDFIEINTVFKRAVPLMLLIFVSQLGIIEINKNLSLIGNGVISNFWFSWKLLALVSIIPTGITYIIFPELSVLISEKKDFDIFNLIKKAFQMTIFLTIPICFFLIIMSHDLVFILFGHGKMNYEDVRIIAYSFSILLIGTPASAAALALSKVAIIFNDKFTIIGLSSLSSVVVVLFVKPISNHYGIFGICALCSFLAWICFFIQLNHQAKIYKIINFIFSLRYLSKVIFLSFASCIPVFLIHSFMDINIFIKFASSFFIFISLVIFWSSFLKVNEYFELVNTLKNLLRYER